MKHLDIKRALAEHGMTQVQLGKKMGASPQSLTFVIKGNPTVEKLTTVAAAIGCDITDLFFDNEQQHAIPADSGISSSTSADAPDIQDAREMMYCPHCGTKFFVVNVPNVGE